MHKYKMGTSCLDSYAAEKIWNYDKQEPKHEVINN